MWSVVVSRDLARAKRAKKPEIHLMTVKELLDDLDEVTALMGLPRTIEGIAALPLPQLDAKRHTVEELLESDRGTANSEPAEVETTRKVRAVPGKATKSRSVPRKKAGR